ncbi:hypothetical protein V8E36_003503 [Tilletia maclaganii]
MTSTSPIIISSSSPPSDITVPAPLAPQGIQPRGLAGHAVPAPASAAALDSPSTPRRRGPPGRGARSPILRLPASSPLLTPPRLGRGYAASASPLAARSSGSVHQGLQPGIIEPARRPHPNLRGLRSPSHHHALTGQARGGPSLLATAANRVPPVLASTTGGPTSTSGPVSPPPPYSPPASVPSSSAPSSPGFVIVSPRDGSEPCQDRRQPRAADTPDEDEAGEAPRGPGRHPAAASLVDDVPDAEAVSSDGDDSAASIDAFVKDDGLSDSEPSATSGEASAVSTQTQGGTQDVLPDARKELLRALNDPHGDWTPLGASTGLFPSLTSRRVVPRSESPPALSPEEEVAQELRWLAFLTDEEPGAMKDDDETKRAGNKSDRFEKKAKTCKAKVGKAKVDNANKKVGGTSRKRTKVVAASDWMSAEDMQRLAYMSNDEGDEWYLPSLSEGLVGTSSRAKKTKFTQPSKVPAEVICKWTHDDRSSTPLQPWFHSDKGKTKAEGAGMYPARRLSDDTIEIRHASGMWLPCWRVSLNRAAIPPQCSGCVVDGGQD